MSKDKNIEMKQAYVGNKSHIKCEFGEFIQPLTVTNNKNVTIQGLEIATEKDNVINKNIPYRDGKGAFGICKNGGNCQFKAMEKVKWENVNENVYVGDARTLNGKSFFRCPYVAGQNIEIIEHNQQAIGAFSEKNKNNFWDEALQMEQQAILMLMNLTMEGKDPLEELRNSFMEQLIKELGYAVEVGAYTIGNDFKDLANSINKVVQNPSLETFSDMFLANNDILNYILGDLPSRDRQKSLEKLSKSGKRYDISINGVIEFMNDNIDANLDEKLKPMLGRKISPEADKWARNTYKQTVLGNGTEEMTLIGTIGEFINSFVPISGQLADARDVALSANKGDGLGVVLSGIGVLPGLDTLKRGPKVIKKMAKKADEAVMAINKAIGTNITPKILDSVDEIAAATKKGAKEFTEAMGEWVARNRKALSQLVSNSMIVSKMDEFTRYLKDLVCYLTKYGCLTAGTKVKIKNGYKNIENIKEGDFVYSFDEITEKVMLKEVKNIIVSSVDEIIKIETENQIIETSLEHPFYIKEKGWVEAKDLQQDDILITLNHEEKIKNISRDYYFEKDVYNLEIEGSHTFYITEDDILTHNKGKCWAEIRAENVENFKKIIKELEGEGVFKIIKEEGNKFLIEYDNAKGAEFIKKAWENEAKLRGNEIEFFRSYHVITENKKWVHVGHYNDGLFPRIDFVDITDPKNPIGISYKTMDLSAESYAKKNVIRNTINRYADGVLKTNYTGSGKKKILKDIKTNGSEFFRKNNHITLDDINNLPKSIPKNQRALIIEVPPGSKIPFSAGELKKIAKEKGLKYIKLVESKF
ncbi:polymorphic toxin-type HINT domain-containing protein [Leptotrichia trevisanii]|uniref:polymorphic toxin-type HINT domain-containing protein n=1 Tax=Leptotrichia trevisanii TaxID=109328 RepID=UPI0026EAD921|nr:polymorphic toxin-type HINT domain-containing protein [Leptotrichia trevisanii]